MDVCNCRQLCVRWREAGKSQSNPAQPNPTQPNPTQPNATQRNAAQRNATQRNATQRNATQRNATQRNATKLLCYRWALVCVRLKLVKNVMSEIGSSGGDMRRGFEKMVCETGVEPVIHNFLFFQPFRLGDVISGHLDRYDLVWVRLRVT